MQDTREQSIIISHNIKRLREEAQWTQAKLAEESGITGAALSKIEKGDGRMPTIVVLRKIAGALKVPVQELSGESSDEFSADEEKTRAFHRKWGMLEELEQEDQDALLGMAERLRKMTKE